jgi:hypothetical protein
MLQLPMTSSLLFLRKVGTKSRHSSLRFTYRPTYHWTVLSANLWTYHSSYLRTMNLTVANLRIYSLGFVRYSSVPTCSISSSFTALQAAPFVSAFGISRRPSLRPVYDNLLGCLHRFFPQNTGTHVCWMPGPGTSESAALWYRPLLLWVWNISAMVLNSWEYSLVPFPVVVSKTGGIFLVVELNRFHSMLGGLHGFSGGRAQGV